MNPANTAPTNSPLDYLFDEAMTEHDRLEMSAQAASEGDPRFLVNARAELVHAESGVSVTRTEVSVSAETHLVEVLVWSADKWRLWRTFTRQADAIADVWDARFVLAAMAGVAA